MARRKQEEDHENHERWLVSYADFITLLFAFFVVMYSISQINEGKYKVLSDALVSAFRAPASSLEPIQVGDPVRGRRTESSETSGETKNIKIIAEEMNNMLKDLIDADIASLQVNDNWLQLDIKSTVLFSSGSAKLAQTAFPILEKIAELLRKYPNPLQVEGFTDNIPINTVQFRSNWELSAARAASVVILFAQKGIDPQRMAAVGYGEHWPVASNEHSEGRSKNRRVAVVLLESEDIRRFQQRRQQELQKAQAPPRKDIEEAGKSNERDGE